jgi:hypothetical protein
VQREVTSLSDSGLIRERRVGRSRLVSADPACRYTRPLTELVSLARVRPPVCHSRGIRCPQRARGGDLRILAARYEGITGHAPHDVDVLVIGNVPRRDMYEAAERAEQRLGLPVNPVLCSQARWLAASDALIQQIRTAPLVWVIGEEPQEG